MNDRTQDAYSGGSGAPTLQNTLVVDAVAHGYNYRPDNCTDQAFGALIAEYLYKGVHIGLQPAYVRQSQPDRTAALMRHVQVTWELAQ